MGTPVVSGRRATSAEARCPLCGSSVLSVSRSGLVTAAERAIPIGDFGRGYLLCDDCGVLADLPAGLTLN